MPRRWKAVIFLTTLLAATLSFATFASARTDNVTVLHFTARQVELHFVDVAPTGGPPSPGDTFVLSEDLYRDGHKVGFNGAVCLEHIWKAATDHRRCGQQAPKDRLPGWTGIQARTTCTCGGRAVKPAEPSLLACQPHRRSRLVSCSTPPLGRQTSRLNPP
jgi:hypothetical protein